MTRVLTINFLTQPAHWLLAEVKAGQVKIINKAEISSVSQLSPEDYIEFALHQIAKTTRSNNTSYDLLHAVIDLTPEIQIDLDLPFVDEKAIQAIIMPELEDRIPIEPENFFVHFRTGAELESGRHQIHASLCHLEQLISIFKAFKNEGLRPNLVTNRAGINSIFCNTLEPSIENFCLVNYAAENFYLSAKLGEQLFLEESIAPIIASASAIDSSKNLIFRLKQLQLQYQQLPIYSSDEQTLQCLKELGITAELIDTTKLIPEYLKEYNPLTIALTLAAEPSINFRPALNLCFGRFANNQITISLIDGVKKVAPLIAITLFVFIIGLLSYYFIQNLRIDKIQTALSDKISTSLERNDLNNVEQVIEENSLLEDQLKTLGAPSGLNPADFYVQLSEDLHRETEIKFNRLRINTNKAVIEGIAPSYAAIDKINRLLKKKSSLYCNITSRSSGAGSSPSFVFEVELCQK